MGEISVFSDFFYILVLEQVKVVTLFKKNCEISWKNLGPLVKKILSSFNRGRKKKGVILRKIAISENKSVKLRFSQY